MSNDISTNRLPPAPLAVTTSQTAKAVATANPQTTEAVKPAVSAIPDPHEARRELEAATEQLNQQMRRNSRDLSFSVDDVANTVVVTVKNRESGEVVRQIPNEVALRIAHNMEDMKGLLQDGKS